MSSPDQVTLNLPLKTAATLETQSDDFLKREAQTQLRELFVAGGMICEIRTNCEAILEAARHSFLAIEDPKLSAQFRMRFWVDANKSSQPPWPKPYVRGLDHLVFAGFAGDSSVLIDLHNNRVTGRFSQPMGADLSYWKAVIFPIIFSVASGSLGVAEVHCACVARNQNGLLLVGPSGSGKSSLSVALGEAGFAFLSDDRTFCSLRDGKLLAWSIPTLLKLRYETRVWFERLQRLEPRTAKSGELEFRIEPDWQFGLKRVRECEPQLLVFLERQSTPGFHLSTISSDEAAIQIGRDLMAEFPETVAKQAKTISKLVELPCWRLRYGGPPQTIAEQLSRWFEHFKDESSNHRLEPARQNRRQRVAESARSKMPPVLDSAVAAPKRQDLLRRFTPTPHVENLAIMGRTVRLESNSPALLELARKFVERYQDGARRPPEFRWRIVCESDPQVQSTEVPFAAFADSEFHYVNLGQRSFLAVDRKSHEGVGFFAERFLQDDPRFHHHLGFDFLFCMSAASLGLTALSAACVGFEDRGVLIFGPPDSGKTTTGYLAAKLGMEFHADQGVFLDTQSGGPRAWGDPFPAAFRPETLNFFPELRDSTCPYSYADVTFHYLRKRPFQSPRAHPVVPVCSVFLERGTAREPQLTSLARDEVKVRIRRGLLFKNEARWERQVAAALRSLAEIPAYDLKYSSDPAIAAAFIERMLR